MVAIAVLISREISHLHSGGPFHKVFRAWLSCQHPSETTHLSRHICLCAPCPPQTYLCTWAFQSSSRAVCCLGCSPEHTRRRPSDISLVVLPPGLLEFASGSSGLGAPSQSCRAQFCPLLRSEHPSLAGPWRESPPVSAPSNVPGHGYAVLL